MANTEDTFDPNDLESIDALLDEAELEAVDENSDLDSLSENAGNAEDDSWNNLPDDNVATDAEPPATEAAEDALDEVVDTDSEDILDTLDDLELSEDSTPEIDSVEEDLVKESEPEVVAVSEPVVAPKNKQSVVAEDGNDDKAVDDFLEKRAQANSVKNTNLSVKEMESIKKLIVIFGSALSVLVLVAIGIGVWSAIAASSAGVDDETKTLIESIKVSSEQNGSGIADNEKLTASVEKKLDAINFQIEQMVADLANLDTNKKPEVIDPLGLGSGSNIVQPTAGIEKEKVESSKVAVTANNPELMSKISTVSSRLYRAQKRIDEINSRLKTMQAQSSVLAQSMKMLEKEALLNQAERDAKAQALKKQEKLREQNPYNYSAPDGGFYDQSVSDSYP